MGQEPFGEAGVTVVDPERLRPVIDALDEEGSGAGEGEGGELSPVVA